MVTRMRYLILSDIHANLEALEAVLATVPRDRFDRLLVLGDIVGYGADPNAVVDAVRALRPDATIRGNHDKVAAGVESAEGFNHAARYAALWTLDHLTPENRDFLTSLPVGPLVIDDLVEICHGSPDDEDEYIFEHVDAIEALRASTQQVCFFGHTHVAIAYWLSAQDFDVLVASPLDRETRIRIEHDRRYLINPGSVGQPRDGDPRAAFATYDSESREVVLYRVPYDVTAAQAKIARAGLPEGLARRLALGK
jgi:diadenosine tetraphosphatase ApaH/serine/threonine PP2A family protein phosphatase